MEFSSKYFTEMLLSDIFEPSVVKYDILGNNRRSKLHAVIDCLFLYKFLQPLLLVLYLCGVVKLNFNGTTSILTPLY